MFSFKQVKIPHGRGNRILRFHIREFSHTIPKVEKCYNEDLQFGGDGITVVKIK